MATTFPFNMLEKKLSDTISRDELTVENLCKIFKDLDCWYLYLPVENIASVYRIISLMKDGDDTFLGGSILGDDTVYASLNGNTITIRRLIDAV